VFRRLVPALALVSAAVLSMAPAAQATDDPPATTTGYNTGNSGEIAFAVNVDARNSVSVGEHVVTGQCHFEVVGIPDSSNGVLVVAGTATATTHLTPVATGLKCVVSTASGTFTYLKAGSGPLVALTGGPQIIALGTVHVCAYPEAYWDDTHFVNGPVYCI
jgi:hypothetical protein